MFDHLCTTYGTGLSEIEALGTIDAISDPYGGTGAVRQVVGKFTVIVFMRESLKVQFSSVK
jgi:hypothetical protein